MTGDLDTIAGSDAVGFDASAAATAFTELENRASTCDPSIAAWAVSQDGFLGAFTGTLASGADCEPADGLLAGVAEIGVALSSCVDGTMQACLPTENDGWTCTARGGAGAECFSDLNCQDGLFCSPGFNFGGECMARKAEGESCDAGNQCQSFLCTGGTCAADVDVQAAYCLADQ
jgi:hypothetical protein